MAGPSKPTAPIKRGPGRPRKIDRLETNQSGQVGPGAEPKAPPAQTPKPDSPGPTNDLAASVRALISQPPNPALERLEEHRGPGRPPKVQLRAWAAPPAAILGRLWSGVFKVIANRAGSHWALDAQETELLGDASHDLIVRYAEVLGKHTELIAFVVALLLVFGPKTLTQIDFYQRESKRAKKTKNGGDRHARKE